MSSKAIVSDVRLRHTPGWDWDKVPSKSVWSNGEFKNPSPNFCLPLSDFL